LYVGFRFNKTQEHFPTLKDYNDYLEEVEDMSELFPLFVNLLFLNDTNWEKLSRFDFSFPAFNLIEGIDVEAIEAKIARYQQENAEQIYLSRAKRVCFVMIRDVVLWSTEIPVEMFYSNF
jgi:CDK-activating kinase assembly factor MAT1